MTGATLTDAVVNGASFEATTPGFTAAQLVSTASYQTQDLRGIDLSKNNLSGWDLSEQNFTDASFADAPLSGATLTDAVVTGASFKATTPGLTAAQLVSTASYQAQDLRGIDLSDNYLGFWDFSEQNLTDANLRNSILAAANFTRAVIGGADFSGTGLVAEQLYSTFSYQEGNLQHLKLGDFSGHDLSGWDFSELDLSGASFGTCFCNRASSLA